MGKIRFPDKISDGFEKAGRAIGGLLDNARTSIGSAREDLPGFNTVRSPQNSGFGVRQSAIPSERDGFAIRNMVRWFVPETGIVEMYINPQNINYVNKKHISQQRTKGGYVLQYWGEELGQIAISGTTGSSGVEGINVLEDVYRAEQLAYDPYALSLAAEVDNQSTAQGLFGDSALGEIANNAASSFFNAIGDAIETGSTNPNRQKPTLATHAFSIEMYWSGWVFRGYFSDFSVTEKADNLGLWDYTLNFNYVQKRGWRLNYLPWHRSATNGPSNSNPVTGVPYSYGVLANPNIGNYSNDPSVPAEPTVPRPTSIDRSLISSQPILDPGRIYPRDPGSGSLTQ